MKRITTSRNGRGFLRISLLFSAVFLLVFTACFPSHPQSTFDAAGPVAKSQLNLFYVIFWTAVFVFVVVEGILLYVAIRFRRKKGSNEIPKQTHGNTLLEIAWTIAPAVVLVVVAVPTVITIFDNATPPSHENAINVKVTAHQWWWTFDYFEKIELDLETKDMKRFRNGEITLKDVYKAKPYLTTANEMNVPVGVPVSLVLESNDVIHSFWIPKLAGKVDIVPQNRNTMWFQADRIDANPETSAIDPYMGQCAEFCGLSHALMKVRVWVHKQDDFDRWVKVQQGFSVEPSTDKEKAGREVFVIQQCWACHTLTDKTHPILSGARAMKGPNLTHFGGRSTIAAGILDNSDEDLRNWLKDPLKIKPGNIMGMEGSMFQGGIAKMTDQEIEELVAYLRILS